MSTFHKPKIFDASINRQPTIGKTATFIKDKLPVDGVVLGIDDNYITVEVIGPSKTHISSFLDIIEETFIEPILGQDHSYRIPRDYIVAAE